MNIPKEYYCFSRDILKMANAVLFPKISIVRIQSADNQKWRTLV